MSSSQRKQQFRIQANQPDVTQLVIRRAGNLSIKTAHFWLLAFIVLQCMAGCSGSKTSDVTGTVLFNGHPLPAGRIAFHCSDAERRVLIGTITDGSYSLAGTPYGEVIVTVETFPPARQVRVHNAPADVQGPLIGSNSAEINGETFIRIPLSYAQAKTSELTATIEHQQQTIDFELEKQPPGQKL